METRTTSSVGILQFLRNLPLFSGISQTNMAELAGAARIKQVQKGTFIFFQDDPALDIYFVWRGAIAIQMEDSEGRELILNEMSPGECFGELGTLTGQPRSTSAEAVVDSEVLLIPGSMFRKILNQEPELMSRLFQITAQRLQNSSKREEALAFHNAEQRLAHKLLDLDKMTSEKGYITLSQEELAQRAGITRQTAATILGQWRTRGWLLTGRGRIVLLNRAELNKFIEGQEKADQF
jgi:CRP/FNR family transcriptional regulator, cyclic AMP receptor protein